MLRVEAKAVALAAASDATLVRVGASAATVLKQAGVPLQAQVVRAQARLPGARSRRAGRGSLHVWAGRPDLKHGPLQPSTSPASYIGLASVGLLGLTANVADVSAQLPGLSQVDGHFHVEPLQRPALISRAHHVSIFLSQSCHRLCGDELTGVQVCDEAKGLVLCLAPLWLPKNKGTEDLHMPLKISQDSYKSTVSLLEFHSDNIPLAVRLQGFLCNLSITQTN